MKKLSCDAILFGLSVAGLAILSLVFDNFTPLVGPPPPGATWYGTGTYGLCGIVLVSSLGLFFGRTAMAAVVGIGLATVVWLVVTFQEAIPHPLNVGSWYGVSEALAAFAATLALAGLNGRDGSGASLGEKWLRVAQILFGLSCFEFAGGHFAFATFTASFEPAWLPAPLAFAYLTGVAHAAAGLGLIIGILPYLAAFLEGVMILVFAALVWVPSFFSHPRPQWAGSSQNQWSELLLTLTLAGAAFTIAHSVQVSRKPKTT